MSKIKIYVVASYIDGGLVAFRTEREAKEAMDDYYEYGIYPYDQMYIEELTLIEDD